MIKKILVLVLALLIALSVFSCTASPTAMKVGDRKVDASEYAYYLNYNHLNLSMKTSGIILTADEMLARAHEVTQSQIIENELMLRACEALELELSKELEENLEAEKEEWIESLGGLSGYLNYLNENAMTDRLYDKLQRQSYLYSMLHDHLAEAEDSVIQDAQALRRFFAENYAKVKYVRLSTLDENGLPLTEEAHEARHEEAQAVLDQIRNGELEMDYAIATYNDDPLMTERPTGITVSSQDGLSREYVSDLFTLTDGETGGIYTYSDGCYILQRLPVDANYYDENYEQILLTAA
ncbi:MAG: hypothetical protein IIY00_03430, partial [Clostridia bacterium]|nr:hypothetical protein [Clostridia bacterium]